MKYIYISLLLISSAICLGQSPEALFEISLNAHPELKALQAEYEADLYQIPQADRLPDPEIGLGIFVLPVETRLGAQNLRLSLQQRLPWFGTRQSQRDLAEASVHTHLHHIVQRKMDILYTLRKDWLQLYEVRAQEKILRKNRELLLSLQTVAEGKLAAGGEMVDVLRVERAIQKLDHRLRKLPLQAEKLKIRINQLLNRPLDEPIQLADRLDFVEPDVEQDSLLALIEAGHPMLHHLHGQTAVSEARLRLNEKEGKPHLGFGVEYINVSSRTDAFPTNNGRDIVQLRAMFSLPLDRTSFRAKATEESLRMEALAYQKENLRSLFRSHIQQGYADWNIARSELRLAKAEMENLNIAISTLEKDYRPTTNTFDEWLKLSVERSEVEIQALQAIIASHLARANLQHFIPLQTN
ncbi:MAG: TolC family protein [Bacteroidota bacterium]